MVAFNSRVLDRAVLSLDLTVGPGVTCLRQMMVDIVARADGLEAMGLKGLAGCNRVLNGRGG